MTLPASRKDDFPIPPDQPNPEKPEGQERLLFQALLSPPQTAEDWLFAYANARSNRAKETMWPHLVEAVEELITEFRQMHAHQMGKALN